MNKFIIKVLAALMLISTAAYAINNDLPAGAKIGGNAVASLANKISDFAAVTSAQLLAKVSDANGTGALVFTTGNITGAAGSLSSPLALSGIAAGTNNSLIGYNGSGAAADVAIGTGCTLSGGTLSCPGTGGTVTTASVASANGFSGSVANASTAPSITLSTTVSGLVKGSAGALAQALSGTDYAPATTGTSILKASSGGFANAVSGTDYAPATSGSSLLKANGSGGFSSAVIGTDYAPATSGSAILKGDGAGGTTAAVTSDFPTLNQNTTGNAATATALASAQAIGGVSFNGSAAITPLQIQPANETTDNTNFIAFFNSASGTAQQLKYNAGLGYNAATNTVTATTFSGALSGNATTATTASTVTTIPNLSGPIASTGTTTSITAQTGTGTTFAMSAAPQFTGNAQFAGDTSLTGFGISYNNAHATTTWTSPSYATSNMTFKVTVIGGGGAGGVASATTKTGGGGGSGAECVRYYTGLTASHAYTIAVGNAGSSSTFSDGTTTLTATTGSVGSTSGPGGAAGTCTNATYSGGAQPGGSGTLVTGTSGNEGETGGGNPWGTAGVGSSSGTGGAASGCGAGGGGAISGQTGGAGATGCVIVEWIH